MFSHDMNSARLNPMVVAQLAYMAAWVCLLLLPADAHGDDTTISANDAAKGPGEWCSGMAFFMQPHEHGTRSPHPPNVPEGSALTISWVEHSFPLFTESLSP